MDYKVFLILLSSVMFYGLGILSFKYNWFPISQIKKIVSTSRQNPQSADMYTQLLQDTYYHHRKSFLDSFTVGSDIVMVGDSLTDIASWKTLFPHAKIVNYGISGDISEGVLNRINGVCKTDAKKAFLLIGINDIQRRITVTEIIENYKSIISSLQKCHIEPIVQSTLHVTQKRDELNSDITELNKQLKRYCQENSLTFIDLNSNMSDNGQLFEHFSRDGIHLNGEGYLKWQQTIQDFIK